MPFNIIMHVCYYLESAPGVLTKEYTVYIYIKGNRLISVKEDRDAVTVFTLHI